MNIRALLFLIGRPTYSIAFAYACHVSGHDRYAGEHLLRQSPVRLKPVRGKAGRGQVALNEQQQLLDSIADLDAGEVASWSLVIELALETFSMDAALRCIRASTYEPYGESLPPDDAIQLYSANEPGLGPLGKYVKVEPIPAYSTGVKGDIWHTIQEHLLAGLNLPPRNTRNRCQSNQQPL